VSRKAARNGNWSQELWDLIIYGGPKGSGDGDRAVVFGKSSVLARWIVVYAGEFPTTRRSFESTVRSVIHAAEACTWCIVWGKVQKQKRKVVTLFSDQWMIYDRYGQFSFQDECTVCITCKPQLSEPSFKPVASAAVEGPVPNTVYKDAGDTKALQDTDELVLTPDAVAYYDERYNKRRVVADEARAEVGECEFELGSSLRVTWIPAQRADKTLMPMFVAKELKEGFRLAKDGLLERLVQSPPPANASWVPIVPEGQATGNLTWKRWLFLQCHVGILGAHRNADKTFVLLSCQVWWPTMKEDVHRWWEKCLTCIRFRKVPQKQETVPKVSTNQDCWEVVMIDMEGPSNPADKAGCKYTMTYICCLCYGTLLESGIRENVCLLRLSEWDHSYNGSDR